MINIPKCHFHFFSPENPCFDEQVNERDGNQHKKITQKNICHGLHSFSIKFLLVKVSFLVDIIHVVNKVALKLNDTIYILWIHLYPNLQHLIDYSIRLSSDNIPYLYLILEY